jgi:hypothetical protein
MRAVIRATALATVVEVTVTAVDDGSGWSPVRPRTQYMMQVDPGEAL